ncbi:uncharacterized protein LOC117332444 [Pecten maximus]|uniref:uncharacterized protein LOC117332444 n=1 Tax=Pecten maximus TaxID=6579 RepID=UPI001457F105|nr:uncharacterized protein LOC117332444 [Pecten maximus]
MARRNMDLMDTQKVSRFLSQHLDRDTAIGSEEIVKVRRLIYHLDEKMTITPGFCRTMFTGSKSEGLDFTSSDNDMMVILDSVIVVQPHDEIPQRDANQTILAMDGTGCRPGYTLLRLKELSANEISNLIMFAMIDCNRSMYLSSRGFIKTLLQPESYQHGPCITISDNGGMEVDHAYCFHCRSWPNDLSDFSYRTKYCVWPPRYLVNRIVKNGCHVVPIGDKQSSLFAMQWRISFASAEKSLVWSFNHVQLKTYALLKMFLRECIERDQSINELLCSYFMKTIVFHAIEHSTPSMWVDDNIVQCFWYCFTILLECVQTGYLPNYFVPTNNMFLSKVTGANRRRLLRVLSRYQCQGYTCLFQCPSLQALPKMIQKSDSMYPLPEDHMVHEIYQDLYVFERLRLYSDTGANSAHALQSINKMFLKCSDDDNLLDVGLLYFIRSITFMSSNSIADLINANGRSNKTVYKQIRRHKRFLHLSSATDVCNGLLSLATFYYNVGSYTKASDLATRVVFACQQRALIYSEAYTEKMCGKGYTLLQKAKRSFVFPYTINAENYKLYPHELDLEAQEIRNSSLKVRDFSDLPPLPYAIFLLVLSTFRLGNIDQSQTILEDLMAVRPNNIYDVCPNPILHNLVGICHQLLGNRRQAILAFEESCRQFPDNLAAAIRIADLRGSREEQKDDTVNYRNVSFQNQSNDIIDDDNEDVIYFHKTLYNIDPVQFVEMSWF